MSAKPGEQIGLVTPGFTERLQEARQRSGVSQNQLARQVGVDPSYLNRIERAEREPPRREIVESLIDALGLSPTEADDLLVSAGHLPRALERLGPLDPTIRLVAEALTEPGVSATELAELRESLRSILTWYRNAHHDRSSPVE